jgi:hypothetical protein
MWMRTKKLHAADLEFEARLDLIVQSGIAIEKMLAWLLAQIDTEDAWRRVPWSAKRAPFLLDESTLSILKPDAKPSLYAVLQLERNVSSVLSATKALEHAPDLTDLRVAVERYVKQRRSGDAEG